MPPSGDGWLHEIKHDGYRAQAQLHEGARIFTRRGYDWAARMPTIAAAVRSLPVKSVILDGELVAVDAKGQAVFYELARRDGRAPTRIAARLLYYAFDLLYLDGYDLRGAPLVERKRLLETLLDNTRGLQLIKYVDHIDGDGAVCWSTPASCSSRGSCRSAPTRRIARAGDRSGSRPSAQLGASEPGSLREDGEAVTSAAEDTSPASRVAAAFSVFDSPPGAHTTASCVTFSVK